MMSKTRMEKSARLEQTIEWMGLRLAVPREWEIVRHSSSARKGSLTFIDRRQQRLKLMWTACDQEPDLEHMLDNQRSRELETDPQSRVTRRQGPDRWSGIDCEAPDGAVTTRSVRYDRDTSRLVEVIILTRRAEADREELVRGLLRRLQIASSAEAARHWCAFDIDVTVPQDFRLVDATVKPADVTLRFRPQQAANSQSAGPEVSVRRMGMADAWYTGDAEKLIARFLPKVQFLEFREMQHADHPAMHAEGKESTLPLQRLLGRSRNCRVLLWKCEPENALYEVSALSSTKQPIFPQDFEVRCCAGDRHA
jgi:hypothetical protein